MIKCISYIYNNISLTKRQYQLQLNKWTGQVDFLHNVITSLDNRVKTMNNDIIRIDTLVSSALGLAPDTERIARADGKIDARKD